MILRLPAARSRPGVAGTTLMEMILFSAIGIFVVMTMVGFLRQGSRLLTLGRKTSGAQGAIRLLLETLAEDAGELVSLENGGAPFDSDGGGTLAFVIRSSRTDGDYGGPAGLRRVEYKLEGSGDLKDCVRTVTQVGGAASASRKVATAAITRLRVWPMAIVRNTGGNPRYQITNGNASGAGDAGASVACLVVDVQAGQGIGDESNELETQPLTAVVTKLWCRNRIAEVARGSLQ